MPNSKGNTGGRDDKSENSSKRGMGSMEEDKQKETTSKSGKGSHEKSTGREGTEENRETGKKGGSR